MDIAKLYLDIRAAFRNYLDLARPYNSSAALLSFALGFYFYKPSIGGINFIIGLVIVVLLHSSFTMQNDLYDYEVDIENHRKTPLTDGSISRSSLNQVILYLCLMAIFIAWFSDSRLLCLSFCFSFGLLAWLYNCPPFYFSRRPVLSITVLGAYYALLPFVFGFLLSGHKFNLISILFVMFFTAQRISVSILKDYKDVKGDKKLGKQTFLIRYGYNLIALISTALCLFTYIGLLAILMFKVRHRIGLLLLAAIVLVNLRNRFKLLGNTDNQKLTRIFQKSFIGENYLNSAILLCLVWR